MPDRLALVNGAGSHVRIDAWRPRSRRSARHRACPARSRARVAGMWRAFGVFLQGWGNLREMARSALASMTCVKPSTACGAQNVLLFDGPVKTALAEAGSLERAIRRAPSPSSTKRRRPPGSPPLSHIRAELHRARGDIQVVCATPPIPRLAEEALLTAIAVAKQQGTRSFELRAALSLAKLYQPIGRLVDAHAVLVPALEGFPALSLLPVRERARPRAERGAAGDGGESRFR